MPKRCQIKQNKKQKNALPTTTTINYFFRVSWEKWEKMEKKFQFTNRKKAKFDIYKSENSGLYYSLYSLDRLQIGPASKRIFECCHLLRWSDSCATPLFRIALFMFVKKFTEIDLVTWPDVMHIICVDRQNTSCLCDCLWFGRICQLVPNMNSRFPVYL